MTTYGPMVKEFLRDRLAVTGLLIILLLFALAALAPYIAPDPDAVYTIYPAKRHEPPSADYLFGTDQLGRDILSRIIFGSRITIVIAVIAVGSALAIGVPIGLLAGYYESWPGELLMRIADIFLSIPQFVLALALASALGPSIENAILALSITYWPWFSRLVYAETISLKHSTFIEATQALGAGAPRTIFLHILPNVLSPIIVRSTIGMGYTILTAAVLGFLGVGAQPPAPEWGLAISESRDFLPGAWWFATFPGLAIFLVVMAFNMFGDGLRDVLDPRLRISGSK
jgi:peptide/nickel transport system permease protein